MRPSDSYQGVDEILQADVMRFMAIIAFCLIAILALVRTVEPTVQAAPAARPVPEPRPLLALRPPPDVEPMPVATIAPVPAQPIAEQPITALVREPVQTSTPTPPREAEEPTPAPTPIAEQPEPGLSLRFASDQDFLRLLNRGDIRVFAFREGEVLAVGQDLGFQPAPAPGRLHELLPETIPDLMTAALASARADAGFRWGVTLPERIAREIRSHLESGASGELVIDRFGEVRLHDA